MALRGPASFSLTFGHAGVASLQIAFHEDRTPERHAMSPGGFQPAIVNGYDVGKTFAARERLGEFLGVPVR